MSVTTYGDIERGDKDLKLTRLQDIARLESMIELLKNHPQH
jgi:hypothetical protein